MKPLLWLSGISLALSACSGPSPSRTPPVVETEKAPDRTTGPTSYAVPGHAGPATLAALAIRYNPRLQALRFRAARLAEKVPQSESLPDPTASLALGGLPETAAGRVDAMVGVTQKVPFPGKRRAASTAAAREAMASAAEAKAYELKLTEQVYSAWWDYYVSKVNIRITGDSRELLKTVEETVQARVAANQSQQADQLRIANEITKLDRDRAEARRVSLTAGARLNALLNRPAGAPLPGASERSMESLGNLPDLLARASASHPEVLSATHQVEAFKARLQRARLEKYPDLTFGIQNAAVSSSGLAPSANGRDQIFGTLGFNLPLWQKPRLAMIREAKAGIAETESLLSSTRADLRYRIEDAYFRAQTAREVARLFRDRLIPDSKQAYEVTLTSYATGETTFLAVIDSWREWLTYQLQYAQNRAQLGKAIATLRAATGNPKGDPYP